MKSSLLVTLALSAGVASCGARTSFYDPADYPDASAPGDAMDVPAGDRPTGDTPSVCNPGLAMCGLGCTDLQSDPANCGRCNLTCPAPQRCVSGRCAAVMGCVTPLALCSGSCIDPRSDSRNCGGCGRACVGTTSCVSGNCIDTCPTPNLRCGARCIDPRFDASNCGGCAIACRPGLPCRNGSCVTPCSMGQTLCGATCVDTTTDPMNCGACGLRCGPTQTCTGARCTAVTPLSYPEFRVDTYGTSNCRAVEHAMVTGDDRGGIALGASGVLYTGDTTTGYFDTESLAARPLGVQLQALVSDLRTDRVYSLASGGAPITTPSRVDSLVEIDPNTGARLGLLRLSAPIDLSGMTVGFFSGYGRIAIASDTQVFDINPTTGVVTPLGRFSPGMHNGCETWGYWGVAETLRGELWIDYVENPSSIVRRRASTGEVQSLGRFSNLGDMCSFTVSPTRRRWYFHHEGTSQFQSADETIGYCDATFSVFTASRYTQSLPPASVTWVDACAAPGAQQVLSNTDDNAVETPLPFAFRYWGEPLSAGAPVNVTSNGWIGLNIPMNAALGGSIPSMELPNNVIAPYWGDNFTRTPGVCVATLGGAPNRRYVVEWNDSYHCCGEDPAVHLSYEVILSESSDTIDFIYNDMRGARAQTAGLENSSGTDAVSVCAAPGMMCPPIATGTRIRFTPTR